MQPSQQGPVPVVTRVAPPRDHSHLTVLSFGWTPDGTPELLVEFAARPDESNQQPRRLWLTVHGTAVVDDRDRLWPAHIVHHCSRSLFLVSRTPSPRR